MRQTPGIAGILARLAHNRAAADALQASCRQMVPGLDVRRPGICDLRDGTLRLNCQSAAQANKLRQATPRLLMDLQRRNLDVNEIKLSVQPSTVPETGVGDTVRRMDGTSGINPGKSGGQAREEFNSLKLMKFSNELRNKLDKGVLLEAVDRLWRSASAKASTAQTSEQAGQQQHDKKRESDR